MSVTSVVGPALALLLVVGCGGGSSHTSVTTDDDRKVKSAMDTCMSQVMDAVATTSAVDTASDAALDYATRTTLQICADRAVTALGLTASHHCTTEGCFGNDDYGYSWKTVALDWARSR